MDANPAAATLSPGFVLLLAVLGLLIPAITALGVAYIGRGGKSKATPAIAEPGALTLAERDEVLDRVGDLDSELHRKDRELERLRVEKDQWQARAYQCGWRETP